METEESKMLSRKWLLTMLIQIVASFALFTGYTADGVFHPFLDGANFAVISSANIAAYSLANMAEYWAKQRMQFMNQNGAPAADA